MDDKKTIKRINNSLEYLARPITDELNIMAIQLEDNVFLVRDQNDGAYYAKVYEISRPKGEKISTLIRMLCSLSDEENNYRMRLSTFFRTSERNNRSHPFFLTVFFNSNDMLGVAGGVAPYYNIRSIIERFENKYDESIKNIYGADIKCMPIERVLSMASLNMDNVIKEYSKADIFNREIYKGIKDESLKSTGVRIYRMEDSSIDIMSLIEYDMPFYSTVDIRPFSQSMKEQYESYIKGKYRCDGYLLSASDINVVMSLFFVSAKEEILKDYAEKFRRDSSLKGVYADPYEYDDKFEFLNASMFGVLKREPMYLGNINMAEKFVW